MIRKYYISFSVKPAQRDPKTGEYAKWVWPKLYASYEQAWRAMDLLPIFKNAAATDNRPRIVSAAVTCVRTYHSQPA